MSRILVIPDSHLNTSVITRGLELAKKKFADKIVMLGDYFDDWFATDEEYEHMAKFLKKTINGNPAIIPLYGNHEMSYMSKKHRASGFNSRMEDVVNNCVKNDHRFLYAWSCDGVLYTHAGLTSEWADTFRILTANEKRLQMKGNAIADKIADRINGQTSIDPLCTVGPARGGNQVPGPLWCDASELNYDCPKFLQQVVGHTPVKEITKIGPCFLTDVFSNGNDCDEYLFVKDGTPEILKYHEVMNYGV